MVMPGKVYSVWEWSCLGGGNYWACQRRAQRNTEQCDCKQAKDGSNHH
jgi:hypothetical protein